MFPHSISALPRKWLKDGFSFQMSRCTWATDWAGLLYRVNSVYLFCARYTYFVHGILILCTVYLLCARYTYFAHGILILCTVYLLCARYTYFAHGILTLRTVYLLFPRDTDSLSAFNTIISGNRYFVHKFLLPFQRRRGSSCPRLN
jgi:hypothetical protein